MLAIRMARVGRKKQVAYRIVVSEKKRDMYGDHLEIVGNYNPHTKVAVLKVERIKYWLSKGAVVSASLHNLLIKEGVITGKKAKAVSLSNARREKIAAKNKPVETAVKHEEKKEEVVEEAV